MVNSTMRRLLTAVLTLALIGAAAFFAEQWEFFAPGPAAPHGGFRTVWIKQGEGSAGIARTLQSAGVVSSATLFRLGVQLRGKNTQMKAGEYTIPSRASMADVMGILISGKSIQHKITAAEGRTSEMIYDIVARDPALTGDAGAVPQEGVLLPETYLFTRGTSRSELLRRMARAQRRLLEKLWSTRAVGLPFHTPGEAVTLASIVEKETALPEERRHIAAVFVNRLRLGMKLQSDPTIIYGITKGYPLGRGIRLSEISAATPYNTYVMTGLPPTPICNPGKDSIAAVLHPEASNDLYFVANGTGGHVFTSSLAEHERNVARWRQMEQAMRLLQSSPPIVPARGLSLRGTADSSAPIVLHPVHRAGSAVHRRRHRH
jgi:UPF0755 protein